MYQNTSARHLDPGIAYVQPGVNAKIALPHQDGDCDGRYKMKYPMIVGVLSGHKKLEQESDNNSSQKHIDKSFGVISHVINVMNRLKLF